MNTGYYFKLERGAWQKERDTPTQFTMYSGLTYIGTLTKQQLETLDRLITDYLRSIEE